MRPNHLFHSLGALLLVLTFACSGKPKGAEAVDLGLPSGLKWASCNLGADSERDLGFYLAWGESEPKDHYFYDNYRFAALDGSQSTLDIGEIISGTQYDMARALWGEEWRLPTKEELEELIDECTWSREMLDSVAGYRVTGHSGKSIFLPAGGKNAEVDDTECCYWSGTLSQSLGRTAYSLYCFWDDDENDGGVKIWGEYKVFGLLVRPVKP